MNTSTRIYKGPEAETLAMLPVPGLDLTARDRDNVSRFVIPAAAVTDTFAEKNPVSVPFAEDPLETAHEQAARILAEAEQSKAFIEQAAYEKAEIEARAAAASEVDSRVAAFRDELFESVSRLSNLSAEMIAHVETELVDLAIDIAKKIVRREVTLDREIALTLVRVSLSKLNQRTSARVHLNPEDLEYIKNKPGAIDFRGTIELVEDPSVTPGGCLVHTETGDVDARIESQFDEIALGLMS